MSDIIAFPRASRALAAATDEEDMRAARDVLREARALATGAAADPVTRRDHLVRMAAMTIREIEEIDGAGGAA